MTLLMESHSRLAFLSADSVEIGSLDDPLPFGDRL
jgi:hypothetical protein